MPAGAEPVQYLRGGHLHPRRARRGRRGQDRRQLRGQPHGPDRGQEKRVCPGSLARRHRAQVRRGGRHLQHLLCHRRRTDHLAADRQHPARRHPGLGAAAGPRPGIKTVERRLTIDEVYAAHDAGTLKRASAPAPRRSSPRWANSATRTRSSPSTAARSARCPPCSSTSCRPCNGDSGRTGTTGWSGWRNGNPR